jgi:hypothetical protein
MKRLRLVIILVSITTVLAACGRGPTDGPAGGGDGISGRVTAPRGVDVVGTVVLACPVINQRLDCSRAEGAEVGRNGSYSIDVQTGSYGVLAWKDENGDEDITAGDYLGIYSEDGQNAAVVRPPADGIDVEIQEAQAAVRQLELNLDALKTTKN